MKIRLLKNLFAADLLLLGSYGLMLPIFAIFLTDRLPDAGIESVSAAAAVWLFAYALFDWTYATFLQHGDANKRARGGLIAGSALVAAVPLVYLMATDMALIYVAQLLLGSGLGLAKSSWSHLMRVAIDEKHRHTVRKMRRFSNTMIMAAAAAIGGLMAAQLGFDRLLWTMFGLGVCATAVGVVAVFANKE